MAVGGTPNPCSAGSTPASFAISLMSEPMVSSSPLKTATSVSGALSAYLHKYVEVATGGRVVFQGTHAFAMNENGWFRFKCKTCQDNWNMKTDLFTNQTTCPSELTNWLEQHKHVCDKFSTHGQAFGTNPKCSSCGWTWNQHKAGMPVQHKAGMPVFDIENNVWVAHDPPATIKHQMLDGDIIEINPATGKITHPQGPAGPQGTPGPVGVSLVTGKEVKIGPGKIIIVERDGRVTSVRGCGVCGETIAVASGSSICDECYKVAKAARSMKSVQTTQSQGRMFRERGK